MAGRATGLRRPARPAALRTHPGTAAHRRPAAYIVFDLLAPHGKDLRDRPYAKRRRKLEKLLGPRMPPGLVHTPTTTGPAVARAWLRGYTSSGIEGVVAKGADQPYQPGVRDW